MRNFNISVILLFCLLTNSFVNSEVKIWEEQLIIPTWEIGPSEKNFPLDICKSQERKADLSLSI